MQIIFRSVESRQINNGDKVKHVADDLLKLLIKAYFEMRPSLIELLPTETPN